MGLRSWWSGLGNPFPDNPPTKPPRQTSGDVEYVEPSVKAGRRRATPDGSRERPLPVYIAPATKTYNYKVINYTAYGPRLQDICNQFAEMGWRVVGINDLTLVLERPVGLTHPND